MSLKHCTGLRSGNFKAAFIERPSCITGPVIDTRKCKNSLARYIYEKDYAAKYDKVLQKKQYHISMTMSSLNGLTALSWIKIRLNIIIKTMHRYAKIRSSIYEDCYVCEIFFNIRFLTNLFLLRQNYLLIDQNKLILTIFFIFVSV